jgi:DNA repair protein RadD
MMLTHVKELIEQNAKTLINIWPLAPVGIYSAGLKQRDNGLPIVYGGIASVYKNEHLFGHRDLLLIDEAHLLGQSDSSMYQKTIAKLKEVNPLLKVIGFTATPYRLGQGMLTDSGLFTDICYDITGPAAFNRLIAEGFLVPLFPKPTHSTVDVSEVGLASNGDYQKGALETAAEKITYAALQEMCYYGAERRCWLVFAAGVKNAENAAEMLQSLGVSAAAVHSKLSDEERNARISAFKRGELRAIVNNNVLTTGFDHPPIDLIGMLRPTLSPGLWVQMLGRGTRPSPNTGKRDCLVLDFARNTARLGPINDPVKPRKKGDGEPGDAPVKICPNCGIYNHASARNCIACGYEFPVQTKIYGTASTQELIRDELPQVEWMKVDWVLYSLHQKVGKPDSIKVSYHCGLRRFNEWVALEHGGLASKKARDWWRKAHWTGADPPATTAEALQRRDELKQPARVRVWLNKQHPEILSHEYA